MGVIDERANRLADALLGLGLREGDRVDIIAENGHAYAEFLFAVAKAGCRKSQETSQIDLNLFCFPSA